MAGDLEPVVLSRPVRAAQIPEGNEVTLDPGQVVTITQALGGSFTVQGADHRKYRIEGRDADALGKDVPELATESDEEPLGPEQAKERAMELMKEVHDPEIPVNIVDLGLVYDLEVHERGDGKLLAVVRMTLTAPGCGMGDFLLQDVEQKLSTIPGMGAVDAKIVFEPVWNPYTMMSDAAKLQLGLL